MRTILLFLSLLLANGRATALLPAPSSSVSNDTFASYQWALRSEGQKIRRDLTDVSSELVSQNPLSPADIGWQPTFDLIMQKNIVVGVIDSGIDLHHPDLIDSLFMNSPECDKSEIPFLPTDDKDGNGFKGDCKGWNFLSSDPKIANIPEDDLGHGTHVSGIIAARQNNGIGLAGVSGRIRILPLKVTGKSDSESRSSTASELTLRVAKALNYSIKMKVDVLNISLGWPASLDSPDLRTIFQRAMDAGITIVAAAGNNNSESAIFPCAYTGVICVGAIGIDNRLTRFSNFGGQVDLGAPGEEILSSFPLAKFPTFFSAKGYEVINGTSQAAPYVSASVAVLKGVYPGIRDDEIKARLFVSSQPPSKSNKGLAFGTLKLDRAIALPAQSALVPNLKKIQRIPFSTSLNRIQFDLEIENLWKESEETLVEIHSLSPQVEIQTPVFHLATLKTSERRQLQVVGVVKDKRENSEIQLQIAIKNHLGYARTFLHSINLSRSLDNDPEVVSHDLPIFSEKFNKNLLFTVADRSQLSPSPDYYWTEEEQGALALHLYFLNSGKYMERLVLLPGANKLINIEKIAKDEYWIGAVLGIGKDRRISYYTSTNNNSVTKVDFLPSVTSLDRDAFSTLQLLLETQADGTHLVFPAFVNKGKIPDIDKNPDPFDFEVNQNEKRVYFLQPIRGSNGNSYKTRLFNNFEFDRNLRNKLNISDRDDLRLVTMLPSKQNHVRLLFSFGRFDLKQFVVVESDIEQLPLHQFSISFTNYSSTLLANGLPGLLTNLDATPTSSKSALEMTLFLSPNRAEVRYFDPLGLNQIGRFSIQSSHPQDYLIGFINGFQQTDRFITFMHSKSNLIAQVNSKDRSTKKMETSIRRSSLLPGSVFEELMFPTQVKAGKSWLPGIYMDATQLYSNNVYVWVVDDQDRLISPAALNIDIPQECRPLAPQKFRSELQPEVEEQVRLVFLCEIKNKHWILKTLPLNL